MLSLDYSANETVQLQALLQRGHSNRERSRVFFGFFGSNQSDASIRTIAGAFFSPLILMKRRIAQKEGRKKEDTFSEEPRELQ